MKPKLQAPHLLAMSDKFLKLTFFADKLQNFSKLHALVCGEIKIKVDKKLAAGTLPHNGTTIKLTPAQLEVVTLLLTMTSLFNGDVEFCNGLTRLYALNK